MSHSVQVKTVQLGQIFVFDARTMRRVAVRGEMRMVVNDSYCIAAVETDTHNVRYITEDNSVDLCKYPQLIRPADMQVGDTVIMMHCIFHPWMCCIVSKVEDGMVHYRRPHLRIEERSVWGNYEEFASRIEENTDWYLLDR